MHSFDNNPIRVVRFNQSMVFQNFCKCSFMAVGETRQEVAEEERAHLEQNQ